MGLFELFLYTFLSAFLPPPCLKNGPWRHAEWDEGKRIRFLDEEVK